MCNDNATVIIEPNEVLTTIEIQSECNEYTIVVSGLGEQGLSAYQIAVINGFEGTEQEWLDSLIPETIEHKVKLAEPIAKGQAVYISGATGANILVSKASNVSEAKSSKTLGLLKEGGATNFQTKVVTEGFLGGLNTSMATIGDAVWLGVDGNLLYNGINKPQAPAHLVYIGVVSRVSATVGEIFVHVQNGFELEELHDVKIVNKQAQQGIYYKDGLWQNDWTWFQYASGFSIRPTKLSDSGGVKIYEYTYSFGVRYRKIDSTIDGFFLDEACTQLIVKKQI